MSRYVLRRISQAVPIAVLVTVLVFSLIHLIPGDPVQMMLGDGALQTEVESLRSELGLDRPVSQQFVSYIRGLLSGDLGRSFHFNEPVLAILIRHYPATIQLALAAMLVAVLVSVPLGALAAMHRNSLLDHLSRFFSLVGVSLPNFWLGPMLILVFAIQFDLFPVSGRSGLASLVLPAITLGTALSGLLTRMIRTSLVEELHKPYLVTARAKGLRSRAVLARHALKNAAIPVVTVVGLQFGALLTGAIITETVFSWPGLGRLVIQAIRFRDYPLVQGAVLAIALTYVLLNLITDVMYAALDPRIRLS